VCFCKISPGLDRINQAKEEGYICLLINRYTGTVHSCNGYLSHSIQIAMQAGFFSVGLLVKKSKTAFSGKSLEIGHKKRVPSGTLLYLEVKYD
jgi:hypothetical protein